MKILLVEDDGFKKKRISEHIENVHKHVDLIHSSSVNSAKRSIKTENIDLVLMDMSLPTFDITGDEAGGRPHTFGGKELLSYMFYRKIYVPVFVITQFERFQGEEGDVDVKALKKLLEKEYSAIFRNIISFSHLSDLWKSDLDIILRECKK
jgi:CheY-like chemotaxis protein